MKSKILIGALVATAFLGACKAEVLPSPRVWDETLDVYMEESGWSYTQNQTEDKIYYYLNEVWVWTESTSPCVRFCIRDTSPLPSRTLTNEVLVNYKAALEYAKSSYEEVLRNKMGINQ